MMKKILFMLFLLFLSSWALSKPASDVLVQEITILVKNAQSNFPLGNVQERTYAKKAINYMYSVDQSVRPKVLDYMDDARIESLILQMDTFHTQRLKVILAAHGWMILSQYGAQADKQAWLLVQHADQDPFFQAGCAFLLERLVDLKETDPKNFAFLYDRTILKFQEIGLKQRYGTQVRVDGKKLELLPYEGTIPEMNKRRAKLNLEPIDQYLATLRGLYFK